MRASTIFFLAALSFAFSRACAFENFAASFFLPGPVRAAGSTAKLSAAASARRWSSSVARAAYLPPSIQRELRTLCTTREPTSASARGRLSGHLRGAGSTALANNFHCTESLVYALLEASVL